MSVKSKVKRCNKEIKKLQEELETYKLSNSRLREKLYEHSNDKTLENIIKFAITNHIGNLKGGIAIDINNIDKMSNLKLLVDKNFMEHAYIIRVMY